MEIKDLRTQLESLNEISKTLMHCQNVEDVVQKALAEVRLRLNVQVASIFLLSKDGVIKRIGIDGVDQDGNPIDKNWFVEEQYEPGKSFSGKAIPQAELGYGKPQYSNNLMVEYPLMINEQPYLDKLGKLRCGISVPLNGPNTTFGTLEVLNKRDDTGFSSEDVYWLMMISKSVADFIVNFRRKERFKVYRELIRELISLEINDRNFDFQKVCRFVAERITADFTPYKACIIRIADQNDDLEIRGRSGYDSDRSFWEERKDGSVQAGSQIVGEVFRNQKPIFIEKIDTEINKFNNKEWIKKHQFKSFVCLPLSVQNQYIGTISVYTQYYYKFYDNYKIFLENIAFLTAAIISRVRIINEVRTIRQERNEIRERLLNASLLAGFETLHQGILHQYKNQLIVFSQSLNKILSGSNVIDKEKEQIINEQKEWISRRIQEIQREFRYNEAKAVPIDINQAIREVLKSFGFEFVDIEIKCTYNKKIPMILINERNIKDIIFNLLSNAEKAIQKAKIQKGEIKITTSIDNPKRIPYIQITIEDNGIGISNDIRDQIFDRGFTTRKEEGGTGIGLFVVCKIVKDYGGEINFESTLGKGTKFYVRIPLKRYLASKV